MEVHEPADVQVHDFYKLRKQFMYVQKFVFVYKLGYKVHELAIRVIEYAIEVQEKTVRKLVHEPAVKVNEDAVPVLRPKPASSSTTF